MSLAICGTPIVYFATTEALPLRDLLTALTARGATGTVEVPPIAPAVIVAALGCPAPETTFGTGDLDRPVHVWVAPVSEADAALEADLAPLDGVLLVPCRPEDAISAVVRALARAPRSARRDVEVPAVDMVRDGLVGGSPLLRHAVDTARQVALSPRTSVLIQGESGTGKELIARLLHSASPTRQHGAFVDLNCAAIPSDLLEAELFGYERGAFTQASRDKAGLMEVAHGGTLFLDEVGELNIGLQAKLLRVLETQTFRRLGGVTTRRADCRVVAATNQDLLEAVQRGLFRLDLYHRLAVFTITVPPLRERREDVLPLAEFFLRQLSAAMNKRIGGFSPAARALLEGYPYPGNVRELRNIVERAVIVETGSVITPRSLGVDVTAMADLVPAAAPPVVAAAAAEGHTLAEQERRHIEAVLLQARGNRAMAARMLQISVPTLYAKMRKYGLETVGR